MVANRKTASKRWIMKSPLNERFCLYISRGSGSRVLQSVGFFDCVVVRSARDNSAQNDIRAKLFTLLTADGGWLTADSILPMTPHKPDHTDEDDHSNDRIELVEVLAQLSPVLAEFHAEPSESQAPRPGAKKGVDVEAAAGHARDAGRQRDKRPDDREQTGDEYRELSPAREEAVGPVEFAPPH